MNKLQYISEFTLTVNIDVFLTLVDNFVKAIQTENPNKCRPQRIKVHEYGHTINFQTE